MPGKKIGILTAGGDCPGLNAVIRAVVKYAINVHNAEVTGFIDGFRGMVIDNSVNLTYNMVSNILNLGGTILGSSNRDNPFSFYFEDTQKDPVDASDRVVDTYHRHGLSALITIGGDGTLSMSNEFCKKGLNIVGVPKTIDNDVQGTDQTFGFDSAVTTATEAIDKIKTTAESHHRVMVVELMGRTAGWLTLMAGIASGGDVIIIPEIPFDFDGISKFVTERSRKGKSYSIIVAAEGAKDKDGGQVILEGKDKRTGVVRLGGIGNVLASEIEKRTGIETRTTVLGHVQRGGSPTPFDRILATRFGARALELVMEGVSSVTVCLRNNSIEYFPLEKVANNPRRVETGSEFVKIARAVGTYI
jgi:ATP-dependent phosphofructokinase / diphosphate-dependent phosphofructokinase